MSCPVSFITFHFLMLYFALTWVTEYLVIFIEYFVICCCYVKNSLLKSPIHWILCNTVVTHKPRAHCWRYIYTLFHFLVWMLVLSVFLFHILFSHYPIIILCINALESPIQGLYTTWRGGDCLESLWNTLLFVSLRVEILSNATENDTSWEVRSIASIMTWQKVYSDTRSLGALRD